MDLKQKINEILVMDCHKDYKLVLIYLLLNNGKKAPHNLLTPVLKKSNRAVGSVLYKMEELGLILIEVDSNQIKTLYLSD